MNINLEYLNIPLFLGIFFGVMGGVLLLLNVAYRTVYNIALQDAQREVQRRWAAVFAGWDGNPLLEFKEVKEIFRLTGKAGSTAIAQLRYEPLHKDVAEFWMYK